MSRREMFDSDEDLLSSAALAMRRNADAVLDGSHRIEGIPEEWAYALLGMAGWLETEIKNLNLRTRPYAVSIAKSFFFGAGEVDLP